MTNIDSEKPHASIEDIVTSHDIENLIRLFSRFSPTILKNLVVRGEMSKHKPEQLTLPKGNKKYAPLSTLLQEYIGREATSERLSWQADPEKVTFENLINSLAQPLSEQQFAVLENNFHHDEEFFKRHFSRETTRFEALMIVVGIIHPDLRKLRFLPKWGKLAAAIPKFEKGDQVDPITKFGLNIDFMVTSNLPDKARKLINGAWDLYEDVQDGDDASVKKYVQRYKEKIELAYENNQGEKIGFNEILSIFLEDTGGDVAKALKEAAVFFKMLLRREVNDAYLMQKDANWARKHIVDQYSVVGDFTHWPDQAETVEGRKKASLFEKVLAKFTGMNVPDFNPHYDLVNQIGILYHTFYIVSLLPHFSADFITVMIAAEHMRSGIYHGSNKMLADLMLNKELSKIEQMLNDISHHQRPT